MILFFPCVNIVSIVTLPHIPVTKGLFLLRLRIFTVWLVKLNSLVKSLPRHATKTLLIPLSLVVGGLFFQAFSFSSGATPAVFGGPDQAFLPADGVDAILVAAQFPEDLAIASTDADAAGFFFFDSASLREPGSPVALALEGRDGLLTYKIKSGDTLSGIASQFGISLNTVVWANSSVRSATLKPGQELTILPISGVLHQVQPKETLKSIAILYGVSEAQILTYNPRVGSVLNQTTLIIPGARPQRSISGVGQSNLPRYPGYYVIPTTGWNWNRLHGNNGVDIANACGTPVYAAASGLVTEGTGLGYNGGYGNRIILEHPNNTKTLYGHLSKLLVSIGDYVSQGDLIAQIGKTGNVIALSGGEGCHLHFEVWGAVNEFADYLTVR